MVTCIVCIGLGGMLDEEKVDKTSDASIESKSDDKIGDPDDKVANVILAIVFALLTGATFTHSAVSIQFCIQQKFNLA